MKALSTITATAVLFFSLGSPAVGETVSVKTDRVQQSAPQQATVKQRSFNMLQDAYQAQISLGSKERSKTEMKRVLNPYFTDEMANIYLKHNAVKGQKQYIVYGTDFPILSIPFFSYGAETKLKDKGDKRIIYQYFEHTDEGPVTYDSHYEAVTLTKSAGKWKVSSITESKEEPK
ncbi:DUF3993 domain-containing protein [Metabacillus sp. KIGAM252]|uniref:DUF3993 domain-containing protein n=1 Tax=Metabacillus flavus TaxID=2823519 RepID=A0ABS5LDI9_9BACI|nr:DUF3993 domain-containing protein [Metabacillus flavus]MBS2968654.1 DUF3993 domain-containing protein [Metabacillus flavus]